MSIPWVTTIFWIWLNGCQTLDSHCAQTLSRKDKPQQKIWLTSVLHKRYNSLLSLKRYDSLLSTVFNTTLNRLFYTITLCQYHGSQQDSGYDSPDLRLLTLTVPKPSAEKTNPNKRYDSLLSLTRDITPSCHSRDMTHSCHSRGINCRQDN